MACAGSSGDGRPPHEHHIRLPGDCEEDYLLDDFEEEYEEQSLQEKRGVGKRGPAKGYNVQQTRKKLGGQKIPLTWEPRHIELRVAVGKYASMYVSEVGKYVRQRVPAHIPNWHHVDRHAKDLIVQETEENFTPVDRKNILRDANIMWRRWKGFLNAHVKSSNIQPAPMPNNWKSQAKWNLFLDYVSSDAFKKLSDQNSINRAQQNFPSTQGRIPNAGHRWKELDPVQNPEGHDPIEIWGDLHQHKGGQFVNEKAKEKYRELKELKESVAPGENIRANPDQEKSIFSKAFGKRRDYLPGLGPTKPSSSTSTSSQQSTDTSYSRKERHEIEKLRKSNARMKKSNNKFKETLKVLLGVAKKQNPSLDFPTVDSSDEGEDEDEGDDVDSDSYDV